MFNSEIRVLVMASGSPLGQSILKALQLSKLKIKIYVSDINDFAAGFYFNDVNRIVLPPLKRKNYSKELKLFLKKNKINAIFPVLSIEHDFFFINKSYFKKHNIEIFSTSKKIYNLCSDKYASIQFLRDNNFHVPDTVRANNKTSVDKFLDRNRFPIFLKPRNGASNKDTFIVQNIDQLNGILNFYPSDYLILQEFLRDVNDYSAGVYISNDKKFQSTLMIQRELKFGLSYRGQVFQNKQYSNYLLQIANTLGSSYSINIQFKVKQNNCFVYEINPRLSSTTYIRSYFGFNEPEMMLYEKFGQLKNYKLKMQKGKFTRFWSEHFFKEK